MSVENKVNAFFNELVNDFSKKISNHFGLSYEEVKKVMTDEKKEEKKDNKEVMKEVKEEKKSPMRESKEKDKEDEITREKIISTSTTKDMLAAFCKKKGLKQSGKKEELVQRLLETLTNKTISSSSSSSSSSKPSVSNSNVSKSSSSKKEEPSVIKAVKEASGKIEVTRNKFGNYEHTASGLVFNEKKLVYARQQSNGELSDLVSEDIELCKKYKLPYKLPENLNVNKNLDDVKIDEIDDEEEDEEDLVDEEN